MIHLNNSHSNLFSIRLRLHNAQRSKIDLFRRKNAMFDNLSPDWPNLKLLQYQGFALKSLKMKNPAVRMNEIKEQGRALEKRKKVASSTHLRYFLS